jgi:hypothetical protein
MLKRFLPFLLTLILGLMLGSFFRPAPIRVYGEFHHPCTSLAGPCEPEARRGCHMRSMYLAIPQGAGVPNQSAFIPPIPSSEMTQRSSSASAIR